MSKQNNRRNIVLLMIGILAVLIAAVSGILMYLNSDAVQLQKQLDLGQKYLEEQNYEQAIVAFDKAIGIDPMSVEAYLGKADAYESMGDYEMALETLQEGYDRTGDERLMEAIEKLKPTLEEWFQMNLSEFEEIEKNVNADSETMGCTVKLYVTEENIFVYHYTLMESIPADSDTLAAISANFDLIFEGSKDVFERFIEEIRNETKTRNIVIRLIVSNSDGTKLYSRDFEE